MTCQAIVPTGRGKVNVEKTLALCKSNVQRLVKYVHQKMTGGKTKVMMSCSFLERRRSSSSRRRRRRRREHIVYCRNFLGLFTSLVAGTTKSIYSISVPKSSVCSHVSFAMYFLVSPFNRWPIQNSPKEQKNR